MEADDDSLRDLVERAKKRPKYVRMVSWEFENETKKPSRQNKRQQKSDQGLEVQEAECEEEEEEEESTSNEECDSESTYYSAEETIHTEEALGEEFSSVSLQDSAAHPYQVQSRYRAPSKKQKRKRRYRMIYCDQTLPFMKEGFGIEEDIQDVVAEIQGKQIHVLREVPSLSILCIKMLRGIRFPVAAMPHLIKSRIYGANVDLQFKKFQYGWLLNFLAFLDKGKVDLNLKSYKDLHRLLMCSIWHPLPYLKQSPQLIERYNKSKITASLMYTSGLVLNLSQEFRSWSLTIYLRIPWLLSALATVVECMLPSQISQRKQWGKNSYQNEGEQLKTATILAVKRVKLALSKRLPDIVDEFLKVALPYAFWARGDIQHATELFCQLSQSENRCRYKALYLNEAGRMHAISGEKSSAAKFYRLAGEAAVTKPKHNKHFREIDGQVLMLLASLNDQGILRDESRSSWNGWRTVYTSDCLESQGAVVHAVEHWLCFHAGSWKGDYLEESLNRLLPLCTQHPEILYHMSLVHALKGDAQSSHDCYCNFRDRVFGSHLPGEGFVQRRSDNLWLPLVQIVKQQGQITCIPVTWRTQLRSLCVQTKPRVTQEADVVSEQLNLRMTPQGFLTGDMQLLLPPTGGIYLDPYTGMITYSNNATEPWRGIMNDPWRLVLPTPLEVYHDEDGVRVQLLMTAQQTVLLDDSGSCTAAHDSPLNDICHLIWSGPDGRKVKVNLTVKFTDLIYKTVEEELNSITFSSEMQRQEALNRLQILYRKGFGMQAKDIESYVHRKYNQKTTDKKKKKREKTYGIKLAFKLRAAPFMFGRAVAMIFDNCIPTITSKFLVIANCSTADLFCKMKIYNINNWNLDLTYHKVQDAIPSLIRPCQNYHGYRVNNADVIHFHFQSPKMRIHVFDQEGSIVDTIPLGSSEKTDVLLKNSIYIGQIYPLIVKDQIIAINEQKRLWCRTGGEDFLSSDIENATSMAAFGDILVVLMEDKVQFVAAHQLRVLGIRLTDNSLRGSSLRIDEKRMAIEQKFDTVQVLATQTFTRDNISYLLCIAALDRTVVCLEVPTDLSKCSEVTVFLTFTLAGYPVEGYIINQASGFLLTFTQHNSLSEAYVEHLCHYSFDGKLLGILPCLGPGPRSFCHAHLPGDPESGGRGLYLYMRDGHNGILGIQLGDH
ncbi:uncharacterized protein LOC125678734 isoform X3 [Ostrea edulis]|nr:uncharacterized protein LOC125678734 isoform X3 [Ostrea edulis]XP_048773358.2 uncharacterized protein LOC125678734 isoform X3 [Ostrea edulis]XP_048773359.2 uncharacterized protein LOC125678734 isoform X3 [Ostrea edulis]XP_048773360.2 uncharacterized protein LOC125678734 isoform X3 [Ostrea edulis]XP_048773361.2 uncharacterized protein LOC125678734 isoform X3 [Ostrea edulis]